MKRDNQLGRIGVSLLVAACVSGCGIPEDQYNLKVKELSEVKADLDEAHKTAEAAKKKCDKSTADLTAQNEKLKDRLAALGQNVSDLETANTQITKERDELRRAREAAEA